MQIVNVKGNTLFQRQFVLHGTDEDCQSLNLLFNPAYLKKMHMISGKVPAGRGHAFFFKFKNSNFVLRGFKRGGLIARISIDRYVWLGLRFTRPYQEYALLEYMHTEKLPVPRPFAAQVNRTGFIYTGALITYRIEDAVSLADFGKHNLWVQVGKVIRQFHDKQIYHADLNAHNILVSQGNIYIIDFDKGKRKTFFISYFWKRRNIKRLKSSLDKLKRQNHMLFTEENWQDLMQGYNM